MFTVSRVAIFGTHWWDGPPRPPAVDAARAADDGLTTTAFAADGDDVSVEFEIDPAVLHDCSAAPAAPDDFRVVSNSDRVVRLEWAPVGGKRTSYVIEAGLRTGSADALNLSLGRTTTYTASRVTPARPLRGLSEQSACAVHSV